MYILKIYMYILNILKKDRKYKVRGIACQKTYFASLQQQRFSVVDMVL